MFIYSSSDHKVDLKISETSRCPHCQTLRTVCYELRYTLFTLFFVLCAVSEKKYVAICKTCDTAIPLEPSRILPLLSKNPISWWHRNSLKVGVPIFIIASFAYWGYSEFIVTNAAYWPTFKSRSSSFMVKFPYLEVEEKEQTNTDGEISQSYSARLESGGVFRVFEKGIKSTGLSTTPTTEQLSLFGNAAIKSGRSQYDMKIRSDAVRDFNGCLGREIVYEVDNQLVTSRIFVNADSVFMVSYITPSITATSHNGAIFLDSFKAACGH